MPEVKAKRSTGSRKKPVARQDRPQSPTLGEARDLLGKMIEFEAVAKERGIDFTTSRYRRLTTAERDFIRAELIADYVRLSASSVNNAGGCHDASLTRFCSKICDMGVPSQELIGTYLAAIELVSNDQQLNKAPWLGEAVRETMSSVLQSCVDLMRKKTERAAKVGS